MTTRGRVIAILRRRLLRDGWPRLVMAGIVSFTGSVGFMASAGLLALGVESMAARYALSVAAAYLSFLGLLRIWLSRQARGDAPHPLELVDGNPVVESVADPSVWREPWIHDAWLPCDPSLDFDEFWVIVAPIVIVLSGLLATIYVVYAAPSLFAELLLDVVVLSGLYRHLQHVEARYWLRTAIHRTWIGATMLAVILSFSGAVMQKYMPGAVTLGDVLRYEEHRPAVLKPRH